jgi:hypothetical protein
MKYPWEFLAAGEPGGPRWHPEQAAVKTARPTCPERLNLLPFCTYMSRDFPPCHE